MTLSSQLGEVPSVDQIAKLEGIEAVAKKNDVYVDT
jgi:hypothetical protein